MLLYLSIGINILRLHSLPEDFFPGTGRALKGFFRQWRQCASDSTVELPCVFWHGLWIEMEKRDETKCQRSFLFYRHPGDLSSRTPRPAGLWLRSPINGFHEGLKWGKKETIILQMYQVRYMSMSRWLRGVCLQSGSIHSQNPRFDDAGWWDHQWPFPCNPETLGFLGELKMPSEASIF